jgi:O-antigen/teichoic acid export membrane protein
MASFRKSLALNFASSSGATAIQFLVTLVIARILSPAEVGIYSIAVVLVNIAHVFRDFGVSTYLQREDVLTEGKVRSAIGVAYAIAGAIAVTLLICSSRTALYFGHAEIRPVMQILAVTFLFIPFSSVALALLLRDFDARGIALGTLWGTLAHTATSLALALAGFGATSLAWANLANVVATGLCYLWLRPANMYYLPRLGDVGGIVRFGSGALFANLVKSINDALPDLVLGKLGSARQVGLVSRANSTVHLFLYIAGSAMNFGSQTYLARAHHDQRPLEPILYRAIALVTAIGWPMLAVTAVAADEVIVGLYGKTWLSAAPAVVPLALMTAIELVFHYKVAAFNAIGRPYLASIPQIVTVVARVALAVVLFSGTIASFGWALMLATLATAPVWLVLQRQYLGCRIGALARHLSPSAILALVTGALTWLGLALADALEIASPIMRLLLLAAPVSLAWLGLLRMFSHPLHAELQLILRNLRPRHWRLGPRPAKLG